MLLNAWKIDIMKRLQINLITGQQYPSVFHHTKQRVKQTDAAIPQIPP
jgi:hypothetical protein